MIKKTKELSLPFLKNLTTVVAVKTKNL